MPRTKLDRKNLGLAKLNYRLRQSIDLYRVIGLSVRGIRKLAMGRGFLAYAQWLAHESIAITICKIFEVEVRHELNSIDAVIKRLAKKGYTAAQLKAVERFGKKFGNADPCAAPGVFLTETLQRFQAAHAGALRSLKTFRDKFAAHSEFGLKLQALPSHDEFEALFEFSDQFYRLVSNEILGVGPAGMRPDVGMSLWRLLQALKVPKAQYDFPRKGP